jgi:hypothetical protein
MSETPVPHEAPPIRYIARLSPAIYQRFEAKFGQPMIDRQCSDAGCDAAFKLGIQYALKLLRDDLVTE